MNSQQSEIAIVSVAAQQTIMSKEFAKSFFPSFTTLISTPSISPIFLVNAWDNIFPDDVSTLCRIPPRRSLTFVIPNRPCLALAALLGVYIGLILGGRRRKYVQQHFSDGKDRYPVRVFLLEQMNHSLSRSLQVSTHFSGLLVHLFITVSISLIRICEFTYIHL